MKSTRFYIVIVILFSCFSLFCAFDFLCPFSYHQSNQNDYNSKIGNPSFNHKLIPEIVSYNQSSSMQIAPMHFFFGANHLSQEYDVNKSYTGYLNDINNEVFEFFKNVKYNKNQLYLSLTANSHYVGLIFDTELDDLIDPFQTAIFFSYSLFLLPFCESVAERIQLEIINPPPEIDADILL